MKITMLGTGNALVTECYNTCFIMSDNGKNFMVDGGGGNQIFTQLKHSGFELKNIHDVFVTHQHIDHLLGIIWIIRITAQYMHRKFFDGDMNIYSHDEVLYLLNDICEKLLLPYQYDYVGKRIFFREVKVGETKNIIGRETKFFDIHSARTKQFGFVMNLNDGKKLTCCGDEPCHKSSEIYVENSQWLLHEAFCLSSDAEIFKPYEKHHSTVKDVAELSERLNVKNLLLYHTEDSHLENRKEIYTNEAKKYFSGKIFVPDDLEEIIL